MERKPHLLKPTVGKYIPKRFIFFDTETDQIPAGPDRIHQILKFGYAGFYLRNSNNKLELQNHISFNRSHAFWTWVDDLVYSKSSTYLIAHNLVFDLTVLGGFSKLPKLGWTLESFYSKGLVSMFRWSKNDIKLIGQDNTNLFPGTLASWGDLFNFPKMKIDFKTTSMDKLETYCIRDVEIMVKGFETWFTFLIDNECGSFKPTVASTAFNTWRHKHLTDEIYIHSDPEVLKLERSAYRGGRTECLFVGSKKRGPFYYLDINNMYGYVLQNYEYPTNLWGHSEDSSISRLEYKLERYAVIAEVILTVSKRFSPITLNGHTAYPVGTYQAVLTTPELLMAIKLGYLDQVIRLSWYRKGKLFESYIRFFRSLREKYQLEDSAGYEKIVKLLINGLYGKFGQKKLDQEKIGSCDPNIFRREQILDLEDNEHYDQVYLGGSIFREKREGEAYNSFPAIAAHVTAYARLYLGWFIDKVPEGHVYYMDTDSLIVDKRGYRALKYYLDPKVLGLLKIELKSNWLEIHAPKDYQMKNRTRIKGIKKSAVKIGPNTWKQEQWTGLAGIISKEMSGPYEVKTITKTRKGIIHSGIVLSTGWIDPFFLDPESAEQP